MLCVFGQHHVTPVKGPAHLVIPVACLGQLSLHRGQNILLLIQLCFDILHIKNAQETSIIRVFCKSNGIVSALVFCNACKTLKNTDVPLPPPPKKVAVIFGREYTFRVNM